MERIKISSKVSFGRSIDSNITTTALRPAANTESRDRAASFSNDPEAHRVRPLSALCAESLVQQIEKGFLGLGSRLPQLSGVPQNGDEAKKFFFSRNARRILEKLGRDGVLASLVLQQTAPASTALYCACATLYCISSFSISCSIAIGQYYNRSLNLATIKYAGAAWANLRDLNLAGASIDKEFLDILGSGNASRTLESLNLSLTFINDHDVKSLRHFLRLAKLYLNGCIELTVTGLQSIVAACPNLTLLGLQKNEIGVENILSTLSAPGDPLPRLKKLWMESEQWSRYLPAIMRFCQTRKHMKRLKIWGIIPKLDYVDANICSQLIHMAPWRKIHIKSSAIDHLSFVPQLRHLQLQSENFQQTDITTISSSAPRLRTFILTSAKLGVGAPLDFRSINRLEELAFVDCDLIGSVAEFPKRLKSFSATIRNIESSSVADKLIDAICSCRHLRKLHLASADSAFKTACFELESIERMISSLSQLEDLAIDRDMFGRGCVVGAPTTPVAIMHHQLLSVKIFSSQPRNILPFIQFAPKLYAFEATDHFESLASIENISRYSLALRSIRLKFDREQLRLSEESQRHQSGNSSSADSFVAPITPRRLVRRHSLHHGTSPSSTPNPHIRHIPPGRSRPLSASHSRKLAKVIGDCFKNLPSLIYVALSGASEKVTNSLFKLRQLRKLQLTNCALLATTLEGLLHDLKTMRIVEIERCDQLDSLSPIRSEKLASIRISSCPDLRGDIKFCGESFPRLEIVDISNQHQLNSVSVSHIPSLRTVTLQAVTCEHSVRLEKVCNLNEVVLDDVACPKLSITEVPQLHRLFVDCDQVYDEESQGSGMSVEIRSSGLRRISWNIDCSTLDEFVPLLKTSPDLQVLDFPQAATEDVLSILPVISVSCPLLRSVGCSDGDLQPSQASSADK